MSFFVGSCCSFVDHFRSNIEQELVLAVFRHRILQQIGTIGRDLRCDCNIFAKHVSITHLLPFHWLIAY